MRIRWVILLLAAEAAAFGIAAAFLWPGLNTTNAIRLAWRKHPQCSLQQAIVFRSGDPERDGETQRLADKQDVIDTDAGDIHVETPYGPFWIPKRNEDILPSMLADVEHYTPPPYTIHPGDTVLDCGANTGVFTRHALAKGAAVVVAIELAPENIVCLRRTFQKEIADGRVIVYPKGVWNKDAELTLNTYDDQSGGDSVAIRFPRSHKGPTVPLTTIDKLASELKLTRVDFIKMDIEGAEPQALEGAKDTIERFRPALAIAAEHTPSELEDLRKLMVNLWPWSKPACGPCTWVRTALVNRLQPEMVFLARSR